MSISTDGRFRMIALDLDGTIVDKQLQVSKRVQHAVRRAMANGVHVTLATGRMFRASRPFAQLLGLQTPIVCYQGAMIGDPNSGHTLYHQPVPLHLARQVLHICQERRLHVNVYLDDELYVEQLTPEAELYARMSRVETHVVGDMLAFLDRDTTKLVIVSDEAITEKLAPELSAMFQGSLYVARSYPVFTEIAHPDCSKSRALDRLATMLGISPDECLAVGDNLNDLDMIQWAGLGVAMAGSSPEVLAVADHVTGSIDEDGAATAIEQFVLRD